MSVTQSQREAAYRIAHDIPDIDTALPLWAKRRNPIILRMLGEHWRVFLPEFRPLVKLFIYQAVVVLATIEFPWVYIGLLTFLLPAVVILPYAFYLYFTAISRAIDYSTNGMAEEFEQNTLRILRTTPFSTREIVLSKVMAAVWRQADEIDQILSYAVFTSVPVLITIYLAQWPPDEFAGINQLLTISVFAACIIRIPLEIFMVASIGAMMGTYTRLRSTAYMSSAVLVFFYFLLINLMRLVDMSWQMHLVVEGVMPVILPLIFIWGAVSLAVKQIEAE